MTVNVSPLIPNPTHHISLKDRYQTEVGLILCDDKGRLVKDLNGQFNEVPVDTTAQKQTSGTSSYNDFEYPYSPIVQDDLSGGRGSLDLERAASKYYDGFRLRGSKANKAYAGAQEKYATGINTQDQNMPGSVRWHTLIDAQRSLYYRFQASASYTTGLAWIIARRKGLPQALTVRIYADSANSVEAKLEEITIDSTRLPDFLSEWLNETMAEALTSGTHYWFSIEASASDTIDSCWLIGVKAAVGSTYFSEAFDATPTAADFDLYFRLTLAVTDRSCVMYQYKEQTYFVVSPATGAPKLYMAGDRGTAQANTGALTKLYDSAKSWTTNQHAGMWVKLIEGPGSTETEPYRLIVSNTGTQLTVTPAWQITHSAATEYVIFGDTITEITGHGLTGKVTDVLVTNQDMVLFAQGDSINIRRMKEETSGGAWTRTYADDGANKAVFLKHQPKANKIVKANNRDATSITSIALASPVAWATASHTFAAAVAVDSKYSRINSLIPYPDDEGTEAIWIFKEDIPFIYDGTNLYPLSLEEMRTIRGLYNGVNPLHHNVYLYFPMGYGLERYYGGGVDDLGPNLGEGLPAERRGPVSGMVGYPGKFFLYIDASATGYSSIMDSDGYHERYRAPKTQRIKGMHFQVTPGTGSDRLWIYQGGDLLYLPFPSETANELEDSNHHFTHEFAVTLSRMHAGLFDVMKIVKKIKLQTENLEVDDTGEPICWFELDFRLNEDTDWQTFSEIFYESPNQEIDLTDIYGLAGKRMQFRLRGYTTDNTKTPSMIAIIVNAVLRNDVKYMWGPVTFRCMDGERTLNQNEDDEIKSGKDKLELIKKWADASSDSMLYMRSVASLFDGKMVFMNTPQTRQVGFKGLDENGQPRPDVFVVRVSFQEA